MSWAEIKKAINSNISKSLDVLITEKCNEVKTVANSNNSLISSIKSLLENTTYGLNAIKNTVNSVNNTVSVVGNIPSVKSVQRGKVKYTVGLGKTDYNDNGFIIATNDLGPTYYYDFTINSVNMNKSIVFISGNTDNQYYNNYTVELLNSNTIRVYWLSISGTGNYINGFTWQVIEFY